jgi:hypothetical protein
MDENLLLKVALVSMMAGLAVLGAIAMFHP